MKRNATWVILITFSVFYVIHVSITIATLNITPEPRQLRPLPPMKTNSRASTLRDLSHTEMLPSLAQLPIYTKEMAAQATRPAPWTCGINDSSLDPLTQQKPMFAFVHIYKTAGSTMRAFFRTYAFICRKGWICLQRCTEVTSSSIQSESKWKNCQVEHAVDRNRKREQLGVKRKHYKVVNNAVLRDTFDMFGGHLRIGAGDFILKKNSDVHPVRHIVFLRDPLDRFISGTLYQLQKKKKGWTSSDFAKLIKERVLGSKEKGEYWDRSLRYLLTPRQAEDFEAVKSSFLETNSTEQFAERKAMTAVQNLMQYNVIIGMTEHMPQSMEILKHVLLPNASKEQEELLDQKATNKTLNVSTKGQVSTSSVRIELEKDPAFMADFEEYVKYEKIVNEYAMNMHLMQHAHVVGSLTSVE